MLPLGNCRTMNVCDSENKVARLLYGWLKKILTRRRCWRSPLCFPNFVSFWFWVQIDGEKKKVLGAPLWLVAARWKAWTHCKLIPQLFSQLTDPTSYYQDLMASLQPAIRARWINEPCTCPCDTAVIQEQTTHLKTEATKNPRNSAATNRHALQKKITKICPCLHVISNLFPNVKLYCFFLVIIQILFSNKS